MKHTIDLYEILPIWVSNIEEAWRLILAFFEISLIPKKVQFTKDKMRTLKYMEEQYCKVMNIKSQVE